MSFELRVSRFIMRRRFRHRKRPQIDKTKLRFNRGIRIPKIIVIDDEGTNLGVMSNWEALQLAQERGLDLVEVSPKERPPICRIMDYGKFQYQRSKKTMKTKPKKIDTKGLRIGLRTDAHDLEFKKNQAEKFLKKGNKVKIEIILRGREKMHQNLARENLQKFMKSISIPYTTEEPIKKNPQGFNTIIIPE